MKYLFLLSMLILNQNLFGQTIKSDTIDFKGKTISAYIVYNTILALKNKQVGESVIIKTDNYNALENDLMAWSRMSGWPVTIVERQPSCYIIKVMKGLPINKTKRLAIIISENGLEELLSPLGLAICCAVSGYDVNIYFQGPSVKILTKGFKEKLSGFNSIFSVFARKGLNKVGHVPAQQKLITLHSLGAKFYVCQPSMDHFGVKEKDFYFEGLTLCEYLTFIEVLNSSDLKFFLQ